MKMRGIEKLFVGEYDIVYTSKTTHHISDWSRALAEMARAARL